MAGAANYLLVLRTLVATDDLIFVLSLIVLGPLVVPVTVLVLATTAEHEERTPPALVAVIGGIVGTAAAGTLKYDTLQRPGVVPMVAVGLNRGGREAASAHRAGLRRAASSRATGLVLGVASGAGFATLETMGHAFGALLEGRTLQAVEQCPLSACSSLARRSRRLDRPQQRSPAGRSPAATRRGRETIRFVGVFAVAVLLHTLWDGWSSVVVHVAAGGSNFIGLLIAICHGGLERERRPHEPPNPRTR